MEEKIKDIVSVFIKVPAGDINDATPIDRAAVKNSILLHRLYAKLASEGMVIENYSDIHTFGALRNKIRGGNAFNNVAGKDSIDREVILKPTNGSSHLTSGIGIDIEEISAMPHADDIREDMFYKMNFTPAEISYCVLQKDTYASLAGLFAAKEAVAKASNNYLGRPFKDISITHTVAGKPLHPEFELSVSHSGNFAIAVAVYHSMPGSNDSDHALTSNKAATNPHLSLIMFFCVVAVLFSILAILIALK